MFNEVPRITRMLFASVVLANEIQNTSQGLLTPFQSERAREGSELLW